MNNPMYINVNYIEEKYFMVIRSSTMAFILGLLFSFTTGTAFTQKKSDHVGFGIKAGVNASNMTYTNYPYSSDLYSVGSLGGFYGGLFLEVPIVKAFSLQTEGLISQLGYRQVAECIPCSMSYNERVTYVSVPLLFKLRLSGLGIYAGPQLGILAQAKRDHDISTADTKQSYKSTDFSLLGGIEYTFRFGLGFDVRYQKGMKDVASHESYIGDPRESEFTMNAMQFGLHFKF